MKINHYYLVALILAFSTHSYSWDFIEKSSEIGINYLHGYDSSVEINAPQIIAGGIAIGDINGDGWDDIFVVTGETKDIDGTNINPNKLFISQKNGTFLEQATQFNISSEHLQSSTPLIVDINNDGKRDLIFGGVGDSSTIAIYLNNGNNSFVKKNTQFPNIPTFGLAVADTDKDGDLDLFTSHWILNSFKAFWLNDGAGNFTDATGNMINSDSYINSFTPIFADINNDNWVDLLLTSDFSSSQYFINDTSGNLLKVQTDSITDENGMGAAVGDYDNDGDLDWFVTAIYDEDGTVEPQHWGETGNRLFKNDGNGNFQDVTFQSNVENGFWGWGTCFADFNNDMYLDIFQVNGFQNALDFISDPSRLFLNNKDGTFTEISDSVNLIDTGMGRAIACFDNDHDGDIDIFINNSQQPSKFFQNNLDNDNNFLSIKLKQHNKNIDSIGAKIQVTTGSTTQTRQILSGGTFSGIPTTQHFGLANNTIIDHITITWPDDTIQILDNVAVNQHLIVNKPYTITGKIIDSITSDPLNNIQVLAYSDDNIILASTYSDVTGKYYLNNLKPNNYHIVTKHPNYINQVYPDHSCGISDCSPSTANLIGLSNQNISGIDFVLTSTQYYYPNLNGIWHNANQSGHGIQIQVIQSYQNSSPTIYATWYANHDGNPIWLTGTGALNKGTSSVDLYITDNASFPPNFDPSDVSLNIWGKLHLNFDSLESAHASWETQYDGFTNGEIDLIKITKPSSYVTNTSDIDSCLNGSFYNTDQSGHGIIVEVLGDLAERLLVTWFTYDTQGNQFWLLSTGNITGNQATLEAISISNNNFPPNFDTNQNNLLNWGEIKIVKQDNNNITLSWSPNSDFNYFGRNFVQMSRLTNVKGLDNDCTD